MLRNENIVRYLVLEIQDGIEKPWYCTSRADLRHIIVESERRGTIIRIIRYYPNNITYDTVLKPKYDSAKEREMIFFKK